MTATATLRLLRPSHWVKNAFVLAGVFFSARWREHDVVLRAGAAFLAFCLAASAVYAWNDVLDAAQDRQHPRKRGRPVASGAVASRAAITLALLLAAASLAVAVRASRELLATVGLYLAINAFYSL